MKTMLLGVAVLLAAPGRLIAAPTADPFVDLSVVRSIEGTDDGTRVSVDIDRAATEQYVRSVAQGALQKYPGVTIPRVAITATPGSSVLGVALDFEANVQYPGGSFRIAGTLHAQVALSIDGKAVRAEVVLDPVAAVDGSAPKHGGLGSASRRIEVPEFGGTLTGIHIDSVDARWIGATLDIRSTAP
jgi:hypothetical protein